MNSIEIFYQVFRARYSLAKIQEALDHGYSLAIFSRHPDGPARALSWLGERREGGEQTSKTQILELSWPLEGEPPEALKKCGGAVVDLGAEIPSAEELESIGAVLPVCVPVLWVAESEQPFGEQDPALPRVYRLDPHDPGPIFCRLVLRAFPELSVNIARDFAQARFLFCRGIMKRTARRNAMLAAASSIHPPPIPIVKLVWTLFATTGETMAITASQLRLCLLMAAIHGRPLDFFDRVSELWPIIGSAFGWRALAREFVGLIPAAGWIMKASLAYSGTWMVGEGSRLYYEHGSPTDEEMIREFKRLSKVRAIKEVKEAFQAIREHGLNAESEDEVDVPEETPGP